MKQKLVQRIIFFLYAAIVIFGVLHHEPWRDEAHVWNTAKEDTVLQIIENGRYSPVPVAWILFIKIFASLDFPYVTMNIVHAAIAITSIGLLLFYSPLPLLLKVIIPFSYYYVYEYGVVARMYVLTILSLHLIASLHTVRLKRPILYALSLALLFQSSFYSLLPAFVLFVYFAIDIVKTSRINFKNTLSLLIVVLTMVYTILVYIPTSTGIEGMQRPQLPVREVISVIKDAIVPSIISKVSYLAYPLVGDSIFWLTLCVFVAYLVSIFRKTTFFVLSVVTFLWLVVTNIFLHAGTIRHHGQFLVYLIFFLWMTAYYASGSRYSKVFQTTSFSFLIVLCTLSIVSSIKVYSMDYLYNFSGAADISQFIKQHHLAPKPTVLYTAFDGESILPYFDKKTFWYPELRAFDRYHINDSRYINLPRLADSDVKRVIEQNFPYSDFLILTSDPYLELGPEYRLLHESLAKSFWSNDTESYWLYQHESNQ